MTTAAQAIQTADELLHATGLPRCELVRGELRTMTPAGEQRGDLVNELAFVVTGYVKAHRLGKVYAAETGFVLARHPDTVRAPDIAFVASPRVPKRGSHGFFEGAPDLAVEMLSPDDRAGEVNEKVQDYLAAGTRSVWVFDPRSRTVTVYRGGGKAAVLREADTLRDEVVPGFELLVRNVFEPA